jgi:hypothetical protein
MINREELLEMCGRDAPEVDTWAEEEASAREVCGEITHTRLVSHLSHQMFLLPHRLA